eukprot:PhF_6_TR32110/c0_g2_i1/m.47497
MPRRLHGASKKAKSVTCLYCGDDHNPEDCAERPSSDNPPRVNTNRPPIQSVKPVKYIREVEYAPNWKRTPKITSLPKAIAVIEDIVNKYPWPEELSFEPTMFPNYEYNMSEKNVVWFANCLRSILWQRRDEELELKKTGVPLHNHNPYQSPESIHLQFYLLYLDLPKAYLALLSKSKYSYISYVPFALLYGSDAIADHMITSQRELVSVDERQKAVWTVHAFCCAHGKYKLLDIEATGSDAVRINEFIVPWSPENDDSDTDGDVSTLLSQSLSKILQVLNDMFRQPKKNIDMAFAKNLVSKIPCDALRKCGPSLLSPCHADVAVFLWCAKGGVIDACTMSDIFLRTHMRYREVTMSHRGMTALMPRCHQECGMRVIPAWGDQAYANVFRPAVDLHGPGVTQYFADMKLPAAEFKVPEPGQPVYVEDLGEFLLNLEAYSGMKASEFKVLKTHKFAISGGAVVASLLPLFPKGTSVEDRRRFYRTHFPIADVDIFSVSPQLRKSSACSEAATAYLEFISALQATLMGGTPFLVTCTDRLVNIIRGGDHPIIQLPLGDWVSIPELVMFADVDCTGVAFDGEDVYFSPRAYHAWTTRTNVVRPEDVIYGIRGSPVYEHRLMKYCNRGFAVVDVYTYATESELQYTKFMGKREAERQCEDDVDVPKPNGVVLMKMMEEELRVTGSLRSQLQ